MVKNDSQCERVLGGTCTYIYSYESTSSTVGTCESKNTNDVICNDIKRSSQCDDGGNILSLNGMCGLYGPTCETLCSNIGDEDICKDDRSDDCFWLIQSENHFSDLSTLCIDKVCLVWIL
jgi:hypothetical protein